jgi:hypothetical protein
MKINDELINYICIMNKKQIILLAATATGLYLVLRGLKKNSPTGLGEEFKNAIGDIFKKKKKIGERANATRCETNLERLGRLFPNNDQYNEQVGLAYQKQGSNFSTWAQSDAKPCFVVGADQGGLQSAAINFTANDDFFNANGCKKPMKSAYNNYIGSDGQGVYFNANGPMSLNNLVRGYKRP